MSKYQVGVLYFNSCIETSFGNSVLYNIYIRRRHLNYQTCQEKTIMLLCSACNLCDVPTHLHKREMSTTIE